jgi:dethiobiotin synthetase
VASALLSLLRDAGQVPAPFKPYESGCEDLDRPADALALRSAAGSEDSLELICPHRFRLPLAPGVAALRLRKKPDFKKTLAAFRSFAGRPLVAEGAGGLLVPLDEKHDVVDLIDVLKLPVLLVGRAGLGTLNHVGLSLSLLRTRGIPVRAVVLSQGGPERDASMRDNAAWLERRHGIEVLGPVRYHSDPQRRAKAFRGVLRPLFSW